MGKYYLIYAILLALKIKYLSEDLLAKVQNASLGDKQSILNFKFSHREFTESNLTTERAN